MPEFDEYHAYPLELSERYPRGYVVMPDNVLEPLDMRITAAYCVPETPLEGWEGPIAVCHELLDGSSNVALLADVSALDRVCEEGLLWVAPVVWYGVRFDQ